MKQEIIIKLPKDAEDIQVYKELSLENGTSIRVEVWERDGRGLAAGDAARSENVFLCSQDKLRKRFYPYDYSCIETSHDHTLLLHPADARRQVLAIKVSSMEKMLRQLEKYGVKNFIRVNTSYAVNTDFIEDYGNNKLTVRGMKRAVVVTDSYKNQVESHLCIISFRG